MGGEDKILRTGEEAMGRETGDSSRAVLWLAGRPRLAWLTRRLASDPTKNKLCPGQEQRSNTGIIHFRIYFTFGNTSLELFLAAVEEDGQSVIRPATPRRVLSGRIPVNKHSVGLLVGSGYSTTCANVGFSRTLAVDNPPSISMSHLGSPI